MGINIKEIEGIKKKRVSTTRGINLEFLNKDIKIFGSKFNDKKKENFYSELGVLLSSGLDIKSVLEIIVNEQKSNDSKKLLQGIYDNVIKGESLSDSLIETNVFSAYEVNSLKIGEESGRINDVLYDLSKFFSKKIKQKRQLINSFTYPVIVFITAFAAVYFMLNFMVPMFVDIFGRFHGNLPKLTLAIINLSGFISHYFIYFVLFLAGITIFFRINKSKLWYRSFKANVLLGLPFIGKIVKLIYMERFFQAMTLLTSSKTPLLKAIKLVKGMISFYPFETALSKVEDDIMHGKLLNESLAAFKLFDRKIISLIKVGEETNQLEYIFDRLNKQYADELEFNIGIISNLMEPVIIIFVGFLVGIILIAMYLPMFQMSTSIV